MPLAASIDVGSNTVRLLAAEVSGGRIVRELLNLRANTRLGEGLPENGTLDPRARERTLGTLKDYSGRLKQHRVKAVTAIGTEALRKASDAAGFVDEVRRETGLEIEIISGEEEAKRTLMGVRAGIGHIAGAVDKLVVDIGGGSTELVATSDWDDYRAVSLPLGAVSLYERFVVGDPPSDADLAALEAHSYATLGKLDGFLPSGRGLLIGTAGTITSLAAVDMRMDEYDPARITGHTMVRDTVARLLSRFCGMTSDQRRLLAGLEPGREDIIVSGTALLLAIMYRVEADSVVVCDYGLREGNLLYYMEQWAG
ncbi:MAG TPA: hypothetical protein VGB23_04935 [Nitrospirota bacterium]